MPAPIRTQPGRPNPYDRLGGTPAITVVVDASVTNVAADTASPALREKRHPSLEAHLVNRIGEVTGWPEIHRPG